MLLKKVSMFFDMETTTKLPKYTDEIATIISDVPHTLQNDTITKPPELLAVLNEMKYLITVQLVKAQIMLMFFF